MQAALRQQPAHDGDAQAQPPIKTLNPKATTLCEQLRLSPSLFSVRRLDLLRKAMDEMAIGLSWFVLYTMTHSAVHKGLDSSVSVVIFKVCNALQVQPGTNKICRGEEGTREVELELSGFIQSPQDLAEGMRKFFDLQPSRDTRQLFRHVETLNKKYLQARYYNKHQALLRNASQLRQVARFVYHRNGIPPTKGLEDDEPTNIDKRNTEVVEHFFSKLVSDFLDDLGSEKQKLGHVCDLYGKVKQWQKTACVQTFEAARAHFDNVRNIVKVYNALWRKGVTPMADVDVTDTLVYLQQKLSPLSDSGKADVSQFVVLALWTRFGSSDADHEQEWETGAATSTPVKDLAAAKVKRYSLEQMTIANAQKDEPEFVTKTAEFLADPIGITHLDVIHRGLDLSAQVLRKLLMEAASSSLDSGDDHESLTSMSPEQEQRVRNRIRICKKIESLCLAPLRPDRSFLGSYAVLYSEYSPMADPAAALAAVAAGSNDAARADGAAATAEDGAARANLVEEFFKRHKDMAFEAQTLSNFVRKDPHFCDPRFLADFFQRIKDDNGRQLIQGAEKLVDVCDHSSHQFNLLKPEAYTREKLQNDLSDILGCIRNIREVLQIPAEVAQSEEKALQELQSMLPHYLRWRSRQLAAVQKLPAERGGPGINKVAKDTVALLLSRLEGGKGTLPALDENDNSQGVLVELLRHVSELRRQKVAVAKGGKQSAAAAPRSRIFFPLFQPESEGEESEGEEVAAAMAAVRVK